MAGDVPPDTFETTKAQLRRPALERTERYADEDEPVTRLWNRRITDGWTAEYLSAVTRR
jgi:enoyl-CoA hydratase